MVDTLVMERRAHAVGFKTAAQLVGMSKRYLENASRESDPAKRLKTVRIASRRLIRESDLIDWFERVAVEEKAAA